MSRNNYSGKNEILFLLITITAYHSHALNRFKKNRRQKKESLNLIGSKTLLKNSHHKLL